MGASSIASHYQHRDFLSFFPFLAIGVASISLVTILYGWVLVGLVEDWSTNPALSHGFLIPPLTAFLVWNERKALRRLPCERANAGFALIGFSLSVYLCGRLGAEFFLLRVSFVGLLAGLVLVYFGKQITTKLAFHFILLASMIPLPGLVYDQLAAPLQMLGSSVATDVAQLFGVSAFRDGNIIHLANISLGVEEACSGLHSLSALLVGSLVVGKAVAASTYIRLILFILASPIAVGVNVVRICGTALLADWDQEWAMGFYHSFSSWLVFLGGVGLLLASALLMVRIFESEPRTT